MSGKIAVEISGTQTVRYSQIKEISLETYQKYEALCEEYEDASRARQREIDHEIAMMADVLINFGDVFDSDEVEDFELRQHFATEQR